MIRYLKILVVTSSSAYELAKDVIKGIKGHEIDVCKLSHPVASLMTTSYIAEELSGKVSDRYDYVIVPGLAIGDASILKNVVGAEVIKGPKYLGDLPDVIKFLESGVKFSTTQSADDIIKDYLATKYGSEFNYLIELNQGFDLSGLKIPLRPPPLCLMYEVVMRDEGDYAKVLDRIKKACKQGADLVVVGLPVNHRVSLSTLKKLFQEVKSHLGRPVGIDVQHEDLIDYLEVDPDIIMNVDLNNIHLLSDYRDKPIVIIPAGGTSVDYRRSIREAVNEAVKLGFSKIIIDPLLKPLQLGFTESLVNYYNVSKEFNYPIMMGLSNVYELFDVDTHSVIALLTSMAMELGVSVLLITEESRKSVNSLVEAVKAREMVYRAYFRKSPPIDVGVDLLIVKEKRGRGARIPEVTVDTHVVSEAVPPKIDDEYYFKIYVDEVRKTIVVDVHDAKTDECLKRYVGDKATSLWREISKHFPTLSVDHYSYLGYELCKAEISLKLGRSYLQDYPLFS